jgi:hypothetical protein
MSNYEWKTKKEKIIEFTRRDPFLKINDLAERANTTPRYVRTILSEANLSLMKLRKDYVRRIENRDKLSDRLLFNYLLNVPFGGENSISLESELLFNNPQDFNILKGNISKDYVYQSYLHKISGESWCINTVVTDKCISKVNNEDVAHKDMNDFLCNFLEKDGIILSNIQLEIELSNGKVADLLEISQLSPLFRVEQTVKYQSQVVILMLAYFNSEKISLSLAPSKGLIISRKNIAG